MDETLDAIPAFDGGPEEETVNSLEQSLKLLETYGAELRQLGGVSRTHVAAMQEAGVELPATAPLNSFSASPSTTNLAVANESLLGAIWNKLKEVGRAILELIRKIFRWIVDFFKKFIVIKRGSENKSEQAEALAEASNKMEQLGVNKAEVSPSAADRIKRLEDKKRVIEERYLERFNDLTADTLTGGKIASRYRSLLLGLPAVADGYERSVQAFVDALKNSDNENSTGQFAALATPEKYPPLTRHAVEVTGGKVKASDDLSQTAEGLKEFFLGLSEGRSFDTPALSGVVSVLSASKVNIGVSTFLNETVLVKAMDRVNGALDSAIRAMSQFKDGRGETPVTKAMHAALMTLQREGNAVRVLVELGAVIDSTQSNLADDCFEWWTVDYEIKTIQANESDAETKAQAKTVHLDLQRKIKR